MEPPVPLSARRQPWPGRQERCPHNLSLVAAAPTNHGHRHNAPPSPPRTTNTSATTVATTLLTTPPKPRGRKDMHKKQIAVHLVIIVRTNFPFHKTLPLTLFTPVEKVKDNSAAQRSSVRRAWPACWGPLCARRHAMSEHYEYDAPQLH